MIENKKMTKREFLAHLGLVTGAAFIAAKVVSIPAQAEEKRRGAKKEAAPGKDTDLPWVDAAKGTALAMAYHPSHKEGDKDAKTDKKTDKGLAWDQRFCHNCSFFTKVGAKEGKEAGKCTLFQGSLVNSDGICNSWAKKA